MQGIDDRRLLSGMATEGAIMKPNFPAHKPSAPDIDAVPPPYNPSMPRQPQNFYEAIDVMKTSIRPKHPHRWLFRLALVQLLLGAVAVTSSSLCVAVTRHCPFYAGVWVSPLYVLNGILGIIAAKKGNWNFFVAHLVSGVLALVATAALAVASVVNWQNIGVHSGDSTEVDCVIDFYKYERLVQIHASHNYDFSGCTVALKIGVSANAILLLIAFLQGILILASAVLCCRRTCTCSCATSRR